MKNTALAFLIALSTFGYVSQAFAARIHNPKWNGYALDWCKNFETGCGQPAADMYCQKRGYPRSTGFQIAQSVPYQTMTVGQNAICNPSAHRCDSFTYVDCKDSIVDFTQPTYNGYRLDWCKTFENGCGQNAAQAFCQKKGFVRALTWQKEGSLSVQTMTVGSNAICNPQFHVCDSFTYVRCQK